MKVMLARYACEKCSTRFDDRALSDFAYGEFLLRSDSGEIRYLNVFADGTFVEVRDIVRELQPNDNLDGCPCSNAVQEIYGAAACDPDERGGSFGITKRVSCPACGSDAVSSRVLEGELNVVQVEVPPVTHALWTDLNADEKHLRVLRLLAKLCTA